MTVLPHDLSGLAKAFNGLPVKIGDTKIGEVVNARISDGAVLFSMKLQEGFRCNGRFASQLHPDCDATDCATKAVCTRPEGHSSYHTAQDLNGHVYAEWNTDCRAHEAEEREAGEYDSAYVPTNYGE